MPPPSRQTPPCAPPPLWAVLFTGRLGQTNLWSSPKLRSFSSRALQLLVPKLEVGPTKGHHSPWQDPTSILHLHPWRCRGVHPGPTRDNFPSLTACLCSIRIRIGDHCENRASGFHCSLPEPRISGGIQHDRGFSWSWLKPSSVSHFNSNSVRYERERVDLLTNCWTRKMV